MSQASQVNNEFVSYPKSRRSWYGLGLQTKGALIIFYIVIGAVLAGGVLPSEYGNIGDAVILILCQLA